jgi:hypothetical protein
MPRAIRGLSLLVAGVGLTLLVISQSGTIHAANGPDFAECSQSCSETSKTCKTQCSTDCDLLFPPGLEQDACVNDCTKNICNDTKQECKSKCAVIRDPPSPQEP